MTMVGQMLGGRYRLDALIGAGGMATVYRARDLRLDRDVAVKVLSPNLGLDKTLGERFEREARFLAALGHPSVVAVHDVGETDGDRYYVMELVEGVSLAGRLAQAGRLPHRELGPVIGAVGEGLGALHDRGFVHRDVKPHNILLSPTGAKLADFGLVRDAAASELTSPGMTVGTLAYLAPELLRGEPATPASDVYALGVVAYLGLTGRLPYPADTVAGLVAAHDAPPPRPSEVVPELGRDLDEPILRALGPPDQRPDARSLGHALAGGTQAGATAPASVPTPVEDRTTLVPALGAGTMAAAVTPASGSSAASAVRTARVRRAGRRGSTARWLAPAAVLLAATAIVLALLANDRRPGTGAGDDATATRAAATATEAPTGTPPPAEAPTPEPTATATTEPTADADPIGALLASLDAFDVAVDEAQGGRGGLRGDKANDLHAAARDVRDAVANQNAGNARERVGRLVERTREIVGEEELAEDVGQALLAAAENVRARSEAAFGGAGTDGNDGEDGD